ncbi:hypothetical protein QFC19_003954 [Naganishia cerealis]|uniref:Uncharacterized protein n=1 Tax=Naganishia cerealis TaxID=610337 RepID=A0ACC2VZ10_9TREE|nr:hypothetical protein QFC19_003954 [Naganishia cerealis]
MSERKAFLYNLGLFSFTSILFLSYSIIFARHVYKGLSSDIWDEVVWVTALAATVFYAQAVHTSYQAYIESQGGSMPPLTVGPFTILPSIIGQATTPVLGSAATYQRIPNDREVFDRYMTATPDLEEDNNGQSGDNSLVYVSPPTPTSSSSASGSPRLQTPGADYFNNHEALTKSEETPSKPSALIRKISGEWFGRRPETPDDLETGNEMHGLGMGSLEPSIVRV